MKLRDRPYQTEAVNSVIQYFYKNSNGNPVVASPQGTGKSVIIARLMQTLLLQWPKIRIMMLTHRKELIQQDHDKLVELWPQAPCGIYSAGLKSRDVHRSVIFGGISSVASNPKQFGHIDLVFIDEAHMLSPDENTTYQKVITTLKERNPNLRVVGFTATPYRLGQGLITDSGLFTDICCDYTTLETYNRFFAEGYLSPLIPKRTDTVLDVSGVKVVRGEYDQKALQVAVDKKEITRAALEEVIEQGENRKSWLIFTTGIEHTLHTAEMLNNLGISCGYVHSPTKQYPFSDKKRDQAIADFKSGKYRAMVNSNILTTGFDHPDIDLIALLNPTQSVVKYLQILGRATRPVYADGYDLDTIEGRLKAIAAGTKQNGLILDFANNVPRLGPINDPVVPNRKGKGGGSAPIKTCDKCGTYNHASVRFCISCGFEFVFQVKIETSASTNELIKTELPIVEEFKVDHISYALHTKVGRPDSVRVSYYCGVRKFNEYICPEHEGFARRKAKTWWLTRSHDAFPENTEDFLRVVNTVKQPTHIKVWTNTKFPEIRDHCFDGSEFGKIEGDPFDSPNIEVFHPNLEVEKDDLNAPAIIPVKETFNSDLENWEDDIPF